MSTLYWARDTTGRLVRVAADAVLPGAGDVAEVVANSFWDEWMPTIIAGAATAIGGAYAYWNDAPGLYPGEVPMLTSLRQSRAIAPSADEAAELMRQNVPEGEMLLDPSKMLCGPGEICEDFQFDMAANMNDLVALEQEQQALAEGIASEMDFYSWPSDIMNAVKRAIVGSGEVHEDKVEQKAKEKDVYRRVKQILDSKGGVKTIRPIRDYFGPQTVRYRRGGYMRRSGAGYPYIY